MAEIALRLETQGGTYTNYPGETAGVFDVTAAAVVIDSGNILFGEDDGRPTLAADRGAVITIKEYAHNIYSSPDDYSVETIDKGIYADNSVEVHDVATQVVELLGGDGTKRIATFIGREAVAACLEQLQSIDNCRAAFVARVALLAVNYAQRTVPG